MIKKQEELKVTVTEKAKGGEGVFVNEHVLVGDEFFGKGRLYAKCKLAPGHSVGNHTHTGEMEVCYFLSGEGTVECDGVETKVKAGDVNLVNPGENHAVINTGNEDLVYMALILYA
ncbi:MAG: cupin domain-containing protein [Christensenellaceae bacterium]|nr:cupin domain-containing protein [Christensenellaceae bacterium]